MHIKNLHKKKHMSNYTGKLCMHIYEHAGGRVCECVYHIQEDNLESGNSQESLLQCG